MFVPSEHGGPSTKYAALFDCRAEFDALRFSYMQYVIRQNLEHFQGAIASVLDVVSGDSVDALLAFVETFAEVLGNAAPVTEEPR